MLGNNDYIRNYIEQWEEISADARTIVLNFFKGDQARAYLWWTTRNPGLGGASPFAMMAANRADKVFKFIADARDCDIA